MHSAPSDIGIIAALIVTAVLMGCRIFWMNFGLRRLTRILNVVRTGDFVPGSKLSIGKGPLRPFRRMLDDVLGRLANQARDSQIFTRYIAHELKRPLGSILDKLDLAHAEATDEAVRAHILDARNRIEVMGGNLSQLLIVGGTGLAPRRPSSVSNAAAITVSTMYEKALEKGLYLQAKIDEGIWTLADDRNLFSAMVNLVENGIKYTRSGGVTVSVTRIDAQRFAFICQDTGLGISAKELKQITMPLYRGASGQGVEGNGLGLSLVRRVTRFYDLSFHIKGGHGGTEARIVGPMCSAPTETAAS